MLNQVAGWVLLIAFAAVMFRMHRHGGCCGGHGGHRSMKNSTTKNEQTKNDKQMSCH